MKDAGAAPVFGVDLWDRDTLDLMYHRARISGLIPLAPVRTVGANTVEDVRLILSRHRLNKIERADVYTEDGVIHHQFIRDRDQYNENVWREVTNIKQW